jgi:hypothetical protein
MSTSYVEIVQTAVDRLNSGEVDGYLGRFAPDCPHWIAGSPDPMPMPEFIESMLALRHGLPDLQLEAVTMFGVDHFVCAQWRFPANTAQLMPIDMRLSASPTLVKRRAECTDSAMLSAVETVPCPTAPGAWPPTSATRGRGAGHRASLMPAAMPDTTRAMLLAVAPLEVELPEVELHEIVLVEP